MNHYLIIAGVLSVLAGVLHILIIFNGPTWYEFFGAGKNFVELSKQGSIYPTLVTLVIASVLIIWGLYAFSGAGLIATLPFLKTGLIIIATIYLLRGLVIIPIYFIDQSKVSFFVVWSSAVSLVFGLFYLLGFWKKYGCCVSS